MTGVASADEDADPLADESAALAGLSRAAILGRAARAGGRGAMRPSSDVELSRFAAAGPSSTPTDWTAHSAYRARRY